MNKQAINPVTIHTPNQPDFTAGRLHIGSGGKVQKCLTLALSDPVTGAASSTPVVVLNEDDFSNAMGHLFAGGELAWAHRQHQAGPACDYTPVEATIQIFATLTAPERQCVTALYGDAIARDSVDGADYYVLRVLPETKTCELLAYLRNHQKRHRYETSAEFAGPQ